MRFSASQLVVLWILAFMLSMLAVGLLEPQPPLRWLGRTIAAALIVGVVLATLFLRRSASR